MADKGCRQDTHEAGQHHQIRRKPVDLRLQCGIKQFTRSVILVGNNGSRDTMAGGQMQDLQHRDGY